MAQDKTPDCSARLPALRSTTDRRFCTQLAPPPYSTAEGMVHEDRRSYLDRRSTWIKDFFMDGVNKEPGEASR